MPHIRAPTIPCRRAGNRGPRGGLGHSERSPGRAPAADLVFRDDILPLNRWRNGITPPRGRYMAKSRLQEYIGCRISLPGSFDVPVVLEGVRPLGEGDSTGYECQVRLPDGSLEEVVVSAREAGVVLREVAPGPSPQSPADPDRLRLVVESARIRLAYAYDRQFAVSLSGIRTLPHQIEAVYQRMLPQPRLRFLLADDPGAGKTIMAPGQGDETSGGYRTSPDPVPRAADDPVAG